MPQAITGLHLIHLTQNFPEKGAIHANSTTLTTPVDCNFINHTLRFNLNNFPHEQANHSIAIVLNLTEERKQKLLGTPDDAYFFGHYLTLE
jgi:hypothetical protein